MLQVADPSKGTVEAAAPGGNQGRCWDQRVTAESFFLLLPALSEINSHMGVDMWFWAGEYCLKTGEGSA